MAEPGAHAGPPAARAAAMVIGLGNERRGDDALGLLVARRLRKRLDPAVPVIERDGGDPGLLDLWSGQGLVVVVDAVRSGGPPGTVHRIEVGTEFLPTPLGTTSTHGISLGQAIALGQVLDRLPRRLVVYGIEATNVGIGSDPSRPVEEALETAARLIEAELAADSSRRGTPASSAGGSHA